MTIDKSVLIVGGSLNGLTTALLLSKRNVPCFVVERHPHTSIQYKFRGISPRSMEIYRYAGIEAQILANDETHGHSGHIARMKNFSNDEISWQGIPWADITDISSANAAVCDQDRLEPILKAHAEDHGAVVRFNTELAAFSQDRDGVTAQIRNRNTGEVESVNASYLIAADGATGTTRETLGVQRHGPGVLQHWMNVIFETDLQPVLQGRAIRSVFLTDINGTFVPREDGRWLMAIQFVPERGESASDFTPARCVDLIRRGAGRRDVHAEIVDAREWSAAAYIADCYVAGRAILLGDAAHLMPPTGGFGGNTGIQDAYNIVWKLDAVLRGQAGSQLIDTYDEERRPVAERTMTQALARLQAWFKDPSKKLPPAEPIVDDLAVIFGYHYDAGAFIAEDGNASQERFENPRRPSGRPGSRAPHMVVEFNGKRQSTIDLFAGQWTLIAGALGQPWLDAAGNGIVAGLGVHCYRIGLSGFNDVNHLWNAAYGASDSGAVLIRPDGFVAWRTKDGRSDHSATLSNVVATILRK
jgi:putative polyketide hydroxylase